MGSSKEIIKEVKEDFIKEGKFYIVSETSKPRVFSIKNVAIVEENEEIRPRNPNKVTLLAWYDKEGNRHEFCWYKGKNYISYFGDYGVYKAKFFIALAQVKQLAKRLNELIPKLEKAHEEWKRKSLIG